VTPTPDRWEAERLLRRLPLWHAPEPKAMWTAIRAELDSPPAPTRVRLIQRHVPTWLAAAALALAVVGGAFAGALLSIKAPSRWAVETIAGTPTVAGAALAANGDLAAGEWLVTDSTSRAQLAVGRIGTVDVWPNTRVRLDRGFTEHRLTLERGTLHAKISAPPRLFVVQTPSARATDLGCAYLLEVDSSGATRIRVTTGWVELEGGGAVSLVPAGLVAEVEAGGRPGVPYPRDFSGDTSAALRRLDHGTASSSDLQLVLDALDAPAHDVTLRRRSGITLWHLLQRVPPGPRALVYSHLARLSPPPSGVTREGTLALDRRMLERWRADLNPMWSEAAQGWLTRLGRRLWELVIR
jgi:hypothetical protein